MYVTATTMNHCY